jgi:hypothetical protein
LVVSGSDQQELNKAMAIYVKREARGCVAVVSRRLPLGLLKELERPGGQAIVSPATAALLAAT